LQVDVVVVAQSYVKGQETGVLFW